jgi:hypothetical protein
MQLPNTLRTVPDQNLQSATGPARRCNERGHVTVCALAHLLLTALEEALKTSGSAFKQPASALRRRSECTIDEYQLSGMEQPVRTLTRFTAGQIPARSLVGHDRFDQ